MCSANAFFFQAYRAHITKKLRLISIRHGGNISCFIHWPKFCCCNFSVHFLNETLRTLILSTFWFLHGGQLSTDFRLDWGNGLTPNRPQAITWTCDELSFARASSGTIFYPWLSKVSDIDRRHSIRSYNSVNFLPNPHKIHPIARLLV